MADIHINYPEFSKQRGPGFWLRPSNLWASRRKIFRPDHSTEWRQSFTRSGAELPNRSAPFSALLTGQESSKFRFIILGDTGEGDRSQYALLPLIRALKPDFIVINGDIAYPAGREEDFTAGFFRPYQGLEIPIWAVPGNHEYYSKHKGEEFYEIFCTYKWSSDWQKHRLRFVRQPGTYWELKDPSRKTSLVVIGIDSGMTANLDGHGSGKLADWNQHEWLDKRLKLAQENDSKVIVLFHIPLLTAQRLKKKTHLLTLHHIIARYPCVRMVICAHEHNLQKYSAQTFRRFLESIAPGSISPFTGPHYLVSGDGGASLTNTEFKKNDYPAELRYPSVSQWKGYVKIGKRIIDKLGLSKTLVGGVVGHIQKDVGSDFDAAGLLSFLLVEVEGDTVKVHPVLMDDVRQLFSHLPTGTSIDIQDEHPPVDNMAVKRCVKEPIDL